MYRPVLLLPGAFRSFILLIVLALWAGNASGQAGSFIQLSPEDKERGLNGVQKNFYFTTTASPTDADYVNAGYFGQRLRPYLAGNQEALDDLNRYRRQKWIFLAERFTFVGAIATYGAQVLTGDSDKLQYFSDPQKVTLGVAAISLLSNVFITRRTNQHFQRAVEAHNAGLPEARQTGFLQRLAPSGIGVAAPTGQLQLALRWQLR